MTDLIQLPGAVIIGPQMLECARLVCVAGIRGTRRNAGQPTRQLIELHNAIVRAQKSLARHNDSQSKPLVDDELVIDPTSYLTTAQAAQRLGCDVRTIQRRAKQLDGIKRSGVWHIPVEAIDQHLDGRSH